MTLHDLIALGVGGAIVTTIGTLAGLVLKEFVFTRSFEKWKSKRSIELIFRKYRDPIVLSAQELCRRLDEICRNWPANSFSEELLASDMCAPVDTSASDEHFKRYKFISTVYRLASFLGWMELVRQEIVFLDTGVSKLNQDFEKCISDLRSDLADGHLNIAVDWQDWVDELIFREEQRAIGEVMMLERGESRSVLGYAEFEQILTDKTLRLRWVRAVARLFTNPQGQRDFRLFRMHQMIVHLVDLIAVLAPERSHTALVMMRERSVRALAVFAETSKL